MSGKRTLLDAATTAGRVAAAQRISLFDTGTANTVQDCTSACKDSWDPLCAKECESVNESEKLLFGFSVSTVVVTAVVAFVAFEVLTDPQVNRSFRASLPRFG